MKAISSTTRATIKAYLEVFIENLIKEYKGREIPTIGKPSDYLSKKSSKGQLKPFHAAIIPPEILRINEFERGFSSRLGTTFEECARLIAVQHHDEAQRGYDITRKLSLSAIDEIEHQLTIFEHAAKSKTERPSFNKMIRDVLSSQKQNDLDVRTVRADLYIKSKDGT